MSNQIPNPLPETLPVGTKATESGLLFEFTGTAHLFNFGGRDTYKGPGRYPRVNSEIHEDIYMYSHEIDWSSLPKPEPKRTRIPRGSVLVSSGSSYKYKFTTDGELRNGIWFGLHEGSPSTLGSTRLEPYAIIRDDHVDWTRSTIADEPKRDECAACGEPSVASCFGDPLCTAMPKDIGNVALCLGCWTAHGGEVIDLIRQRRAGNSDTVACLDCGKRMRPIEECQDSQQRKPLCSECWPKSDERFRAGNGLVVPKPGDKIRITEHAEGRIPLDDRPYRTIRAFPSATWTGWLLAHLECLESGSIYTDVICRVEIISTAKSATSAGLVVPKIGDKVTEIQTWRCEKHNCHGFRADGRGECILCAAEQSRAAAPDHYYQGRVTRLCPCGAQIQRIGQVSSTPLCGDCRRERDTAIIRQDLDRRIAAAKVEVDPVKHPWDVENVEYVI